MSVIIGSEEMRRISSDSTKQKQKLQQIVDQLNGAVTGSDRWRSLAAEDFRAGWAQDKGVLQELVAQLEAWSKKCEEHAKIADAVNRPFR